MSGFTLVFEAPQDRIKSWWKQESYMMFSQQTITSLTTQQATPNLNWIQSTNWIFQITINF